MGVFIFVVLEETKYLPLQKLLPWEWNESNPLVSEHAWPTKPFIWLMLSPFSYKHTVLENGYNHTALTHDKKTVVKWLADFGFFIVAAGFCFCPFRLWNNPYRRHTQSLKQARHFVEHYSLRWFVRRHCCWPCRANRQIVALCYAAGYVLVYSLRSPPKQPQIRMAGHRSRDTQSTPHLCLQKCCPLYCDTIFNEFPNPDPRKKKMLPKPIPKTMTKQA